MSNTSSLNATSGGRGMISGIASLNYSSASTDFPSTEPRGGGGGLMPPPLGRKKLVAGRGARGQQTNLSSGYRPDTAKSEPTPTPPQLLSSTNAGGFLDDSFNTPTFGHVARCMTTSKQLDLSSVRMRLDMSSPSLFVLSPVVTATTAAANAVTGGESKTTSGDSPGGGNTPSSNDIKPSRQKRSLRESPLKANSANSACLNHNITPGLSTPNAAGAPNNQNNAPMTRRSSRLFGSSQQSVSKENSTSGVQKAPTKKPRGGGGGGVGGGGSGGGGAPPKSPSRKSNKARTALSAAQQQQQVGGRARDFPTDRPL